VYSAEDMWHLSLVGSSNSAVNALVRASGISKEDFVKLMNNKAQEMRLRTAKFTEPTGLDVQNVASAEDTARILREALRRDKIFNTLQIAEYYAQPEGQKPKRVWSTNWLLTHWVPSGYDELSIAGKTGYIVDSKYNFAVRLEGKNGHAIRVVVMGSENNESRFSEARDVADWVFEHYLWPDEDGYLNLAE
jgi:D-alanyl-D-alanine carboxypeptidase